MKNLTTFYFSYWFQIIWNHVHFISFLECQPGYTGQNCDLHCRYPSFGQDCQEDCNCDEKFCDTVNGCNGEYFKILKLYMLMICL